jgi:hypothetical protein
MSASCVSNTASQLGSSGSPAVPGFEAAILFVFVWVNSSTTSDYRLNSPSVYASALTSYFRISFVTILFKLERLEKRSSAVRL